MMSNPSPLTVKSIQDLLQSVRQQVDTIKRDAAQASQLAEPGLQQEAVDVTLELVPNQTQRLPIHAELKMEHQKYQDLFEYAPDAYLVTTLECVIQDVNCAAERLFEQSREDLSNCSLTAYIAPKNQLSFFVQLNKIVTSECEDELEIVFQKAEVVLFMGSATISLIQNAHGLKTGLRWLIRDASNHRRLMSQVLYDVDQVLYDTFHDRLTGLSNRMLISDHLAGALARCKRDPNDLFAILFLDIDRFRTINDSLGRIVGDRLLMELASRLQECVRTDDVLARLEGDEFLLLLDRVNNISEVESCAGRMQAILSAPYRVNGYKIVMHPSIGICMGSDRYFLPSELIRDASLAMYQAQRAGGACYRIFTSEMYLNTLEAFELEQELHRAIEHQEFEVFYQPIVSLDSQRLAGFEALVRWRHPQRGLLAPGIFLPAAEAAGMIVSIDLWMLQTACQQMAHWHKQFRSQPLALSVNVSSQLFIQTDLSDQIQTILDETGLDPAFLTLEITEGVLMTNVDQATSTLIQLRDLGVKLAIDDFGTGYSSLSRLQNLPFNCLKIDRSFLWSAKGIELVQPILLLAKTLGLYVVTEGVETQAQMQSLVDYGCEYAQGYYFSFPINQEAAELMICSKRSDESYTANQ